MKRVLVIIGGLVLLCIVAVVALIGGIFFLTQDMAVAGDAFMQAIQDNRLDDAYAMLSGEALDDVSDFMEQYGLRPQHHRIPLAVRGLRW